MSVPRSLRSRLTDGVTDRLHFPLPPFVIASLGREIRGVVLVGNNPHIADAGFARIVSSDLVVHFNSAIHVPRLAARSPFHLFVFRSARSSLHAPVADRHFGYPLEFEGHRQELKECQRARVGIVFTEILPAQEAAEPHVLLPEPHPLFETYPRPDIPTSGPSSGFLLFRLFESLRRTNPLDVRRPRFTLKTMGFFDAPDASLWEGHNWEYERRYLERAGIEEIGRNTQP